MLNLSRQENLIRAQAALDDARIAIIGMGAVGSVTARNLVRTCQPKTLWLVDGDEVEDHNLNRQFYTAAQVGRNKAIASSTNLKAINKDLNIEVVPNYIDEQHPLFEEATHVIWAADTLYLEGKAYRRLRARDPPPVFISPRMSGFFIEVFTYIPGRVEPTGIYFSDSPDKNYGESASCTGAPKEERATQAIAVATEQVSAIAALALLASTENWPLLGHIRFNMREVFGGETATQKEEVPVPA